MNVFLAAFHLLSQSFFGLALILGIAFHFTGEWAKGLQTQLPVAKKAFWPWTAALLLVLVVAREHYHFAHFTGRKAFYFTTSFLFVRSALIVLASWFALRLLPRFPAASLALLMVAGNFFAFDWGMSLEGHWFSSMYGLLYLINGVQLALALLCWRLMDRMASQPRKDWLHLSLVFTLVWFYFNFSQFIIVWMGNLPREVVFYQIRLTQWGVTPILLVLALKLIPLGLIGLSPSWKLQVPKTKAASLCVALGCLLEILWVVRFP